MRNQLTNEERKAKVRASLPSNITPLVYFDDLATGRECIIARLEGAAWILWHHPDGQWVTWRKVTRRDMELISKAAMRQEPQQERR